MSSLDDSDVGEGSSTGKKKQPRKSKEGGKQSTAGRSGSKASKKKKESSGSGDKTEEEIARLKKLIVACGVRWVRAEARRRGLPYYTAPLTV